MEQSSFTTLCTTNKKSPNPRIPSTSGHKRIIAHHYEIFQNFDEISVWPSARRVSDFAPDPVDVLGHLGVDAGLPCPAAPVAPAAKFEHNFFIKEFFTLIGKVSQIPLYTEKALGTHF